MSYAGIFNFMEMKDGNKMLVYSRKIASKILTELILLQYLLVFILHIFRKLHSSYELLSHLTKPFPENLLNLAIYYHSN